MDHQNGTGDRILFNMSSVTSAWDQDTPLHLENETREQRSFQILLMNGLVDNRMTNKKDMLWLDDVISHL